MFASRKIKEEILLNVNGDAFLNGDIVFKRKFSVNPCKTLRMPLMKMDFFRDWINEEGGDPYPFSSFGENTPFESISGCRYTVFADSAKACAQRIIGQHFPFASYEVTVDSMDDGAETGFSFIYGEKVLRIFLKASKNGGLLAVAEKYDGEKAVDAVSESVEATFVKGMRFSVTCCGSVFSAYLNCDKKPIYIFSYTDSDVSYADENVFTKTSAALYTSVKNGASVTVSEVSGYLEAGECQADIRSIRCEDGTPYVTDGRVFFTLTVREKCGGYQAVVSLNPSFCDFRMEGAIFFDYGDNVWYPDIASSVIYDRRTKEWYVWAVSFTHDHMLICGKTKSDLRYGINLVSVKKTEPAENKDLPENEADELFCGKFGDEDPDFLYDEKSGKWYLAVCRTVNCGDRNRYRYFLFESDNPFSGYRFKDKTVSGSDTGGSFVRICGKLYFVCGSDGSLRANYHAYPIDDFSNFTKLKFDYDDGGFRGWGTIVPLEFGRRTKLLWLTFDRHNFDSENRWSYGNLYAFEAFV